MTKVFFSSIILLIFTSCATYTITVDSFKTQFERFDTSSLREVTVQDPLGKRVSYKTYPIDYIEVVDKKGRKSFIEVKPSLEMRITDSNNRKAIFYFDLIRYDGEYISGSQSRILPSYFSKRIPVGSIRKIEIQDGRKKFKYVE
jgi:hypothetical protein